MSLEKVKFAVVGGSGLETLFQPAEQIHVDTQYGTSTLSVGMMADKHVAFLARHGVAHSIPPHKINYRANVCAMHELGVERIVATNAVGAINRDFRPAQIVIPHDFVDFTKRRCSTFYDDALVTHIDVSEPYCPELRKTIIENARKLETQVHERAVLVCTEGPRLETPAEIELFRRVNCDIVGMTGFPEVVLARELEMCYATVCYVSNMAAGIQDRLSASGISEVSKQIMPHLGKILTGTIGELPDRRKGTCPCANALRKARFE